MRFVQLLALLRRLHVEFRRETSSRGGIARQRQGCDVVNVGGTEMKQGEWQRWESAHLRDLGSVSGTICKSLLLLLNGTIPSGSSPCGCSADDLGSAIRYGARYSGDESWDARDYRLDAAAPALWSLK